MPLRRRPASAPLAAALLLLPLLLAPALPALPERSAAAAPIATPPAAGSDAAGTDLAQGDAAWERRAEGHAPGSGRAAAAPIGEAIAAYRRAQKAQPERLEVYWKLLRALHFQGQFAAAAREQKQAVFGPARDTAEAGLTLLARRVGGRERLDAMSPEAAAKALAGNSDAIALHLWAGIHWALWGDNFGRLAAARLGVGERVRRYAQVVIAMDERYESAGGHRLLGRLHTLAPRVPFITGWIDRRTAVAELDRAAALAPDYLLNEVFLADALLQFQPARGAEARQLLHRVLARPPAPAQVVEDEDAAAQARQLLAKAPG